MAKTKNKTDETLNFIIKSNLKKCLNQTQKFDLNGAEVELPSLKIRNDALAELMSRLNEFVLEQVKFLKASLPKFNSGDKQGTIKFKTITKNILNNNEFPNLKQPSSNSFKESMNSLEI